jgi:hypothetical protein
MRLFRMKSKVELKVRNPLKKCYRKEDIPKGAQHVRTVIERGGVIDYEVRGYEPLKDNERWVYFYKTC